VTLQLKPIFKVMAAQQKKKGQRKLPIDQFYSKPLYCTAAAQTSLFPSICSASFFLAEKIDNLIIF